MKLFITGTESFVGKELIVECDKNDFELCGCDYKEPTEKRFKKFDIRSRTIDEIIPDNLDAIIHLASLSTDQLCKDRAYDCFDVNVMGTLNLIDIAKKKKCKNFIFASSEWVYDNFSNEIEKTEDSIINVVNLTSEYALSKLVSEANLRQKYQHGFCNTTILRFGIIYGMRKENWSAVESVFNSVRTKAEVSVGSLKTGRFFIHVNDIAKGIIKAISLTGFNVINLEGSRLVTLGEIIDVGKKITGKNIVVKENNPNNVNIRKVSNKKAESLLEWKPKIDIEQGLKMLNEYLSY